MQRYWKDSEGNKGRIILFSEMPDYVASGLQKKEGISGKRLNVELNKEYFKCLTIKQLDTMIMRFWKEMSVKRIAEELHISRQAVEERLKGVYKTLHNLHIVKGESV